MLEQSDIAHYLLSLGLVKPRDIVDEDFTVVDASRRNCVFLATPRAGPTYVVKQAGPRTAETLAHEAAVLRVLAEVSSLRSHVPTVVHHDSEAVRLVLRTPGDARDWSDHHSSGRFPRTPAQMLGQTLRELHRLPGDAVEPLPSGVDSMWALSLPEPSHDLIHDLSAAAQDLVALLQASRFVCERLNELRHVISGAALVHGDLRWENCLAMAAPGSRRRTGVMLVDWELAGPGPMGFDVGTVFAEYLRLWVGSIPIIEPSAPGRFAAFAAHPLSRMRPAIQALWSAYGHANPRRPPLRRVVELAGVRLLQTAVEHAQGVATASAHDVTLMQLAGNLIRHPEYAALSLMALHE